MADEDPLEILKKGTVAWNNWRKENPDMDVDLTDINFRKGDLTGCDFSRANLHECDMSEALFSRVNFSEADLSRAFLISSHLNAADFTMANLTKADLGKTDLRLAELNMAKLCNADLTEADLTGAKLMLADLRGANLSGANLSYANLSGANLLDTDLSHANLTGSILQNAAMKGTNLTKSILVETHMENAILTECRTYGASVWNVHQEGATQSALVITDEDEPIITVDNLQLAQFIYLLLDNKNIRDAIDTITSKVVLILGRFSKERKMVLEAMKERLLELDLTPILFDVPKPVSKDLTGTIETLARMARFILADLSDPSSIPHELATLIPYLRTTPVRLIKQKDSPGYSMIEDYERAYKWVLKTYEYTDCATLVNKLPQVIKPANEMAEEFRKE